MGTSVESALFVLGMVLVRGLLTMWEAGLAAARPSRLRERAVQGDRGAAAALAFGKGPKDLAAVPRALLVLPGVLAGVQAGAQWGPALGRTLETAGMSPSAARCVGTGALALAIAGAMLVLGELVPRRIAQLRPEAIARQAARTVLVLGRLVNPILAPWVALTDLVLNALGVRPRSEPLVIEETVRALMKEGARTGVFTEAEHDLVRRALRFGDRRARSLMTPRNQIVWIDLDDSPDDVRRKVTGSPHSRFLVCDGGLDNLLGVVHVKDLLDQGANFDPFPIKGHLTLPLFLYEGTSGTRILELFKAAPTHNAVVLDEFGTVEGLLTLTDIVQAILGDLPETNEGETARAAALELPDGSWSLDGRMPMTDFRDLFELPEHPNNEADTLAGFIVARLGHVPQADEHFHHKGLLLEVTAMDGNRVDRVRARRERGTARHE